MKYQLRTFKDIIDAVCENLKIQKTDVESVRRIKRNINTILLDHVVPFKRWRWLNKTITLQTEPLFQAGTATVTQNQVQVTLTQAPATSRRGYYFSADGTGEVYRIASHVGGSLNLVLETPYNSATNLEAGFKIWTDAVPLPADCKETVEITHPYMSRPMTGMGQQEFRRLSAAGGVQYGRPHSYTTGPYKDPEPYQAIEALPPSISRASVGLIKTLVFNEDMSPFLKAGDSVLIQGAGHFTYNIEAIISSVVGPQVTYTANVPFNEASAEDIGISVLSKSQVGAESSRDLLIYPSLSQQRTTLLVDYQVNIEALEADDDEPPMPVEDRGVLYYGAMWLSASRERNPEWAQENLALMERKLNRMAGKTEDTPDRPIMRVSANYLRTKRNRLVGSKGTYLDGLSSMGGPAYGGGMVVTGTPETVAIFDESGNLVGSDEIDLAALEFLIGTQGGLSAAIPPGTSDFIVNSWDGVKYKHMHVTYGINRGSAFESGLFIVSSDGTNVATAFVGSAGLNDIGLQFKADFFSGEIRLLVDSDSSGPTANMSYRVALF